MKLSMAMLGALFAAVAAAVEVETLNGSNLLGLVRITSDAEYLPIAVACGAVGRGDAAPSADALVLTAGLAPGDSLYVYDRVNAQYRVFDLVRNEDGDEWQGRNVVHVSDGQAAEAAGAAAGDTPLAVGYGVWLHRPGAAKRANQTVLVVGQVLKSEVRHAALAGGQTMVFGQTQDSLGYVIPSVEVDPAGGVLTNVPELEAAEYEETFMLDRCFGDHVLETALEVAKALG